MCVLANARVKLSKKVALSLTPVNPLTKKEIEKKRERETKSCSTSTSTSTSSNTMSSSVNLILLLSLFIFAASIFVVPVSATDHIVGANRGWNPSINYTLWSNNQTFYVGDFISFRYQKTQYNVFEVNQTGYDNCTTEGAVGNWTSGKDFIMLNDSKRYYFICGNGQCLNGMKVSVVVHPLPSPPSSSVGAKNSSSDSAIPMVYGKAFVGLRVVLGLVATIWVGPGLM